jgi:hypothetical protein
MQKSASHEAFFHCARRDKISKAGKVLPSKISKKAPPPVEM